MKHSEAVQHTRNLLRAVQKMRSITLEQVGTEEEIIAMELMPWVFGDKCLIKPLAKVLDGIDAGGIMEPMTFYNFMTIVFRFEPALCAGLDLEAKSLPEPDISWVTGWEEETK